MATLNINLKVSKELSAGIERCRKASEGLAESYKCLATMAMKTNKALEELKKSMATLRVDIKPTD